MLGRPYALRGTVVTGDGVGRDLGAPTANLSHPPEKLLPGNGVYFVTAENLGRRPGLLYVGTRPTLGEGMRVAEVHILDFEGDLYGSELVVAVHRRLRGDARFSGPEELKRSIMEDIERARALSEGGTGM